jgi:DNA repair protein RadC
VVALAQGLLDKFGGAGGLANASFREIMQYPGVGVAKVAQLKAALEIGRRAAASVQPERPIIRSVADAVNYLVPEFVDEEQEVFLVGLLDTKHRIVGKTVLYRGTLNQTVVRPAEVFREAVRANCAAVLVAHNHPSGDPTPSADDVAMTRQLEQAGKLLDISLVDHFIVTRESAVSLREKGLGFSG